MTPRNAFRPALRSLCVLLLLAATPAVAVAQAVLEAEHKLNDQSIFFDGERVKINARDNPNQYDYAFGPALVPHGDCIKVHEQFVFLSWYRGGEDDRHMMLTRLNTENGVMKTIEFPHRHTGWQGKPWIGETHNTIAIGISPLNGTIHLLFDMHGYSSTRPPSGIFAKDYMRYSYTVPGAATVADEDFKLDLFVKSPDGDHKHLTMDGVENESVWGGLTYPKFFLSDTGDLYMTMRKGFSRNGKMVISQYDGSSKWSRPLDVHVTNADKQGLDFTYGVYGEVKFAAGKIRLGFQKRSGDRNDRYVYQNGMYYATSDGPLSSKGWQNHRGQSLTLPMLDPDQVKVFEPGDLVKSQKKDQIHMVGRFDFNATDRGDEHLIARVSDNENNVTKSIHLYRAAGDREFTMTTDFGGGEELYASGNSILLITLRNGRPFVQQTEGGTNNWQTLYGPTDGRVFDKGVPYIHEGKLYYYLKVPGKGDTRTTYLQIIDLGLDAA